MQKKCPDRSVEVAICANGRLFQRKRSVNQKTVIVPIEFVSMEGIRKSSGSGRVERLRGCENIVALAKELHVSRRQLYRWRDELDPEIPGMELPRPSARTSGLRKEVNHLKRVLAEKTLEVDFFKSALQRVEARRQPRGRSAMGPIPGMASRALASSRIPGKAASTWHRPLCSVIPRSSSSKPRIWLVTAVRLLGISKRGNAYLRRLFVLGARAVLQKCHNQPPGLRAWLAQLTARTHPNVAIVTLANKLARWHGQCLSEGSSITLRCWPIRLPDEGLQMTLG